MLTVEYRFKRHRWKFYSQHKGVRAARRAKARAAQAYARHMLGYSFRIVRKVVVG
jgi:hypothetical protein